MSSVYIAESDSGQPIKFYNYMYIGDAITMYHATGISLALDLTISEGQVPLS